MKNYNGLSNDKITGGGSFIEEKEYGHEIYNFKNESGKYYGYVQPVSNHIKIENLGVTKNEESIKNVLVVWVSRAPSGGVFIIGWYKNATLHRYLQYLKDKRKRKYKDEIFGYFVEAMKTDCKLLKIDERIFRVPRGGLGNMGQSNVWYAKNNEKLKNKVLKYISTGQIQKPKRKRKNIDYFRRTKVEQAAINDTIKHYQELGYDLISVENDNLGWDLEATNENKKLLIEVKGLSQGLINFQMTPNEYQNMNKKTENYRISVLCNALNSNKYLSIFSYSPDSNNWEDDDGNSLEIKEITGAQIQSRTYTK